MDAFNATHKVISSEEIVQGHSGEQEGAKNEREIFWNILIFVFFVKSQSNEGTRKKWRDAKCVAIK